MAISKSRCPPEPSPLRPNPFQFTLVGIFILTAIIAVGLSIIRLDNVEVRWLAILLVMFTVSAVGAFDLGARKRLGFALISAGICLLTILILLLAPPLLSSRPPGFRTQCSNNLRSIIYGIMSYEMRRKKLPPAIVTDANGKPMHSWRVQILQELGYDNTFRQYRFSEPWNSPRNSKITAERPEIFHCPSDKTAGATDTSYVAVLSPKSTWGINQSKSIDAIKDGADNTILLIEMKNSGIHWAEPRDLDLSDLPPSIDKQKLFQSLSNHNGGVFVAYASGRIEFLPFEHSSLEYLEALVSRNGGETIEWHDQMPQVVHNKSSSSTSP